MTGIEKNPNNYLKLGKQNGVQIDLNAFDAKSIKKNETNKSIFEKFDFNKDNKLDENEIKSLVAFLKNRAGNDGILSKREIKGAEIFGKGKTDIENFYGALNDMHAQSQAAGNIETVHTPVTQPQISASEQEQISEQQTAPATQTALATQAVQSDDGVEETSQQLSQEQPVEETQTVENKTYNLKVNYQDTWYGIVQAKYNLTDNKQIKEVISQLKAQNNVDPKATNMPKEITLPEKITLKDGTEIGLSDIDAEVDKSHWGFKTQSETGRYTITQNGKTRYYAADGTELKQSYYEAKEASADKRNVSEHGSGRYSYTAENGETWYFAADGTPIKKEYFERRENEYSAVNAQKETVKNARAAFQQQLDSDGWAGKTADAVSVLWNSDNRAVKVEEDLKNYENQVKELQNAQSQGAAQFSAKFKEIYGVPYNPENVAAYEANPTDENYKKAYGTKNDIHKRVMDYNKSQQDGAAAVKTTVVVAASAAAAVATGGTSLAATAVVAGTSTMAARTVVEVTDLATNNIEGDINGETLDNIAEQAMKEGAITAATAGLVKGVGGVFGKAAPKAAPKPTGGQSGLVKANPTNTGNTGGLVRAGNTGNAGGTRGLVRSTGKTGNTGGTSGSARAGNTGSASGAGSTASQNLNAAKDLASKVGTRGGLNNLTQAEKTKLADMLGITPDKLSNLSRADYRKLALKFHPDKNPGDEFATEMFTIINNLRP